MEKGADYYDMAHKWRIGRPGTLESWRRRIRTAARYATGSVLDLGCGLGQMSNFTDQEYLGVDFSPIAIRYARHHNRNPSAHFVVADIKEWTPNGERFDTVMLLEVLEHLNDPCAVVRIAESAARKRIVASVPVMIVDPAHVKYNWTRADIEDLLGELSSCKVIGGRWLAVKDKEGKERC